MTSTIRIREALVKDAPAIATILAESIEHLGRLTVDQILVQRVLPNLKCCFEDNSHSIYIAEDDDLILGYISIHWLPYLFFRGPEGYVSELYVTSTRRGFGVGSSLLMRAIQEADRRQCTRLSLLNNRQQESYHRSFYIKKGWRERETMANFVYWLEEL